MKSFTRREWFFVGLILFVLGIIVREIFNPATNTIGAGALNGFQSLLIDGSVALIMAVVISYYFQQNDNDRLASVLDAKAEKVAENVYSGVFNSHLPSEYVSVIVDGALKNVHVIRDYLRITYTLQSYPVKSERLGDKKFIRVVAHATMNYRSVLAGAENTTIEPALSLPNPLLDELKGDVKIVEYKVRDQLQPIEEANRSLQEQLVDDEQVSAVARFGPVVLRSGESMVVEATYHMIKELEDTELLRTLYPCKEMEVTVVDYTGLPITVRARAVHFDKAEGGRVDSTNTYRWSLKNFAAPHQGMMVWWKEKPEKK